MTTPRVAYDTAATSPPNLSLRRSTLSMPSAALRSRVLAAVDDVLAADAGKPAVLGEPAAAWIAVAAVLLVGLLLPAWLAAADAFRALGPLDSPSLARRARVAGIADLLTAADRPSGGPRLASPPSGVDDGRLASPAPTPFDLRSLLQGDL